jgi:hypothetical protein
MLGSAFLHKHVSKIQWKLFLTYYILVFTVKICLTQKESYFRIQTHDSNFHSNTVKVMLYSYTQE